MVELSSPESLSPNRLNQALISETLSEFSEFEFVSNRTNAQLPTPMIVVVEDSLASHDAIKKGKFLIDFIDLITLDFIVFLVFFLVFGVEESLSTSETTCSEKSTSSISLKQSTPPILRRGNRRRGRSDSSSYEIAP